MLNLFRKTFTFGRLLFAAAAWLVWFTGDKPAVSEYIEEQRKWLSPRVLEAVQAYASSPLWVPLTLFVLLFGVPFALSWWRSRRDLPPHVKPLRAFFFGSIGWDYRKSGRLIPIESQVARRDSPMEFFVGPISFYGHNISAGEIYQLTAHIELDHSGEKIQLDTIEDGQWVPLSKARSIPAGGIVNIGCQRPRIPLAEFLRDIGGFTLSVTCDGRAQKWHFSHRAVRRQFERQMRELLVQRRNRDLAR